MAAAVCAPRSAWRTSVATPDSVLASVATAASICARVARCAARRVPYSMKGRLNVSLAPICQNPGTPRMTLGIGGRPVLRIMREH